MATTYHGEVGADYLKRVAELVHAHKSHSYALMNAGRGSRVLDIGCGPGIDTVALAHIVGPGGLSAGVDSSEAFINEANRRAAAEGTADWTVHLVGDAVELPFENECFDTTRCERMLQHLEKPEQAIAEMVRVTSPGGRVVVGDVDWGTLSIDAPDKDLERRIVRFNAEIHRNGYAGRELWRHLKEKKIGNLTVAALPICMTRYGVLDQILNFSKLVRQAEQQALLSAEELQGWLSDLQQRDAEGCFFASVSGILVAGSKP